MLEEWKANHTNIKDMYLINDVCHNVRSTFFSKPLRLKLPVPTLAFVNVEDPEGESEPDSTNFAKLREIRTLKKHNPKTYKAIVFTNKTHCVYDMVEPAKEIIKQISIFLKKAITKQKEIEQTIVGGHTVVADLSRCANL